MARVPDHLLRDWIVRLNHAADSPHFEPGVAAELRSLALVAAGFLSESPHTPSGDKRRGLGRGLEALIPTDPGSVADIEELRLRLRGIAAAVAAVAPDEEEGAVQGTLGL